MLLDLIFGLKEVSDKCVSPACVAEFRKSREKKL
jgi:hypothetical protein